MLGWPHHSAGMMVSWDVHGQVSGALRRKMVPLQFAAGFARMESLLDFSAAGILNQAADVQTSIPTEEETLGRVITLYVHI